MKLIGIRDKFDNVLYVNTDKIVTIQPRVPTLDGTTNIITLDNDTVIHITDKVFHETLIKLHN